MKLIVGLGNPGKKYQNNRHNIGFMIIDFLAASFGITNYELSGKGKTQYAWLKIDLEKVEIIKPQTFMNNSGYSVGHVMKNHHDLRSSDICVIHDDLDIQLGSYKLQFGKGPHQHKGVLSIEEALKTKDFWRLRVGIENRSKINPSTGSGLTLSGVEWVENQSFDRLRIDPERSRMGRKSKLTGEEYVLSNFAEDELKQLESGVFPKAGLELKNWLLKRERA